MFKIDFMSSLKENKINGFDLAILNELAREENSENNKSREEENDAEDEDDIESD